MVVVQINSTYGTGSNGRLALQLFRFVNQCGHISYYVYSKGVADINSIRIGNIFDTIIHAFLSRISGLQGYFSYFATKRMLRRLKRLHPDVIHLHNLHSNYINLRLLFDYISKEQLGLVITLHDCWFFTGKCVHPIYSCCDKFKTECCKCPQIRTDMVNPTFFIDTSRKCQHDKDKWFNMISSNNLFIVGVSKWITNEALKSKIFRDKKCVTIYNWLDNASFKYNRNRETESKYHLPLDKNIILMVSSFLSDKKGYNELCSLSKELSQEYQLVYVGDLNGHSLPSNVIHINKTNKIEELVNLYSSASVCLNLSSGETFGMVTLEAMSCGTPVVVYNNTASPELVSSDSGRIVNKEDGIKAIIESIYDICNRGKDYYINKCIAHAKKSFSKEKSLNSYLELYTQLCRH